MIVTWAPAITAPLGSATAPKTVATSVCGHAYAENTNNNRIEIAPRLKHLHFVRERTFPIMTATYLLQTQSTASSRKRLAICVSIGLETYLMSHREGEWPIVTVGGRAQLSEQRERGSRNATETLWARASVANRKLRIVFADVAIQRETHLKSLLIRVSTGLTK
jgi:hypothetical protein